MSVDLQLAESFAVRHGEAAARIFAAVEAGAAAAFFDEASEEAAVSLMTHMRPTDAARCVRKLDAVRAAQLLQSSGLHRCVLILRHLDRTSRDAVVARFPAAIASKVERLLRYPEGSAGWLADSSAIAFGVHLAVAEAKRQGLDPRFPYVYLVDRDQRLVGAVHVNDILTSPDHQTLDAIAKPAPVRVSALTGVAELTRHRAWAHLDVLPVVDSRGVYVGALRHKSLRQLQGSPVADGGTGTPLVSVLELAEMYWSGLSSVFLPVSGGVVPASDSEPSNED